MLMMLPFEQPTIFESIPRTSFRMPRVVKDQRSKFENDDLFRQLSHESAVKYTGFKDRPVEERQMKFIASCQEGHTEISVVQSGNQFTLMFNPTANPAYNSEGCDFDKELGKVHIKSTFILNGVCVFWRGWIDLQRLEGFGCLEFDEFRAGLEKDMLDQMTKQQTCNSAAAAAAAAAAASMHHENPFLANFNQHHQLHQHHQPPPPPLGHLSSHLNGNQHALNNAHLAALNASLGVPTTMASQHLANLSALSASSAALPPASLAAGTGQPHPAASQQQQQQDQTGVTAFVAAFHQALGGPPGQAPPPGGLHSSLSAQMAALHNTAASLQSYNNGNSAQLNLNNTSNGIIMNNSNGANTGHNANNTIGRLSPPNSMNANSNHSNRSSANSERSVSRSPIEQLDQKVVQRQDNTITSKTGTNFKRSTATKRAHEEQTQLDDVDVVSDIQAHDLDFLPRRIFKSSPGIGGPGGNQTVAAVGGGGNAPPTLPTATSMPHIASHHHQQHHLQHHSHRSARRA